MTVFQSPTNTQCADLTMVSRSTLSAVPGIVFAVKYDMCFFFWGGGDSGRLGAAFSLEKISVVILTLHLTRHSVQHQQTDAVK